MSDCTHKPYVYPNGCCSVCRKRSRDCQCDAVWPPNEDGEIVCTQCWEVIDAPYLHA